MKDKEKGQILHQQDLVLIPSNLKYGVILWTEIKKKYTQRTDITLDYKNFNFVGLEDWDMVYKVKDVLELIILLLPSSKYWDYMMDHDTWPEFTFEYAEFAVSTSTWSGGFEYSFNG